MKGHEHEMNKKGLFIGIISIIIFFNNIYLFAQSKEESGLKAGVGLSVEPGGMLLQGIFPGETYDLYEKSRVALTIHNRDTKPHTYLLSTHKPSTVGNRKWLKGYLEIPDPRWFWFEKDEVRVEAEGKAEVRMYLRVPKEERYYNQHWTVSLGIGGRPGSAQMVALAVYPRVQIETVSREKLRERPDGLLGFEPSTVLFEDLCLGTPQTRKVKIYNNHTKAHKYNVISLSLPVDMTREVISSSPTYSWLPELQWVLLDKRTLRIGPNGSTNLSITVDIPQNPDYYNRKWEAILLIEPETGPAGFIRGQIQTQKGEK